MTSDGQAAKPPRPLFPGFGCRFPSPRSPIIVQCSRPGVSLGLRLPHRDGEVFHHRGLALFNLGRFFAGRFHSRLGCCSTAGFCASHFRRFGAGGTATAIVADGRLSTTLFDTNSFVTTPRPPIATPLLCQAASLRDSPERIGGTKGFFSTASAPTRCASRSQMGQMLARPTTQPGCAPVLRIRASRIRRLELLRTGMKISAQNKIGCGFSHLFDSAASPLPTRYDWTTSSFKARETIFCILLLSSATRMVGTTISSRPDGRSTVQNDS